jgi:hypothetical protein
MVSAPLGLLTFFLGVFMVDRQGPQAYGSNSFPAKSSLAKDTGNPFLLK